MPSQATKEIVDMATIGFDGTAEIAIDRRGDQTIVEVDRDGDRWSLLFDSDGDLEERTPAEPVPTPNWLGPAVKKAAPQLRVA